ncbi:MAG: RNA polymerase factor sigma-54 [Verrucomicrobiota bacterium]
MSQGLHLSQRMSQQMVLSPQLQQSLAMLQAPVLELKALVEQELQQNPLLEEVPALEATAEERELREEEQQQAADPAEPPADTRVDPAREVPDGPADDFEAELQKILQMDQEWRDHFSVGGPAGKPGPEDEERRQFLFDSLVVPVSLQQELLEQVRLADLPEADRPIAEMLVGNIDDHGLLPTGLAELSFSTGLPMERIEQVLKVIQTFNPPGVGARDLRECLLLQLERAGRTGSPEYRIVRDHFEALGRRRFPEIARQLGITPAEAQEVAGRIALLNPRPGLEYAPDENSFVLPEVKVTQVGDDYQVHTENEFVPHLRISNTYKDLLSRADTSPEVREYIREKIRAGKFLIKSIHQRQDTITRIAQEIVTRQREFMEHGVSHLKPMTMVQVAEVVGVHETTVSRAVSGKYLETPQGVFEMKYFFTSGLQTASGETMSNTSVKTILAELVAGEDTSAPLSDEELVARMKERGILIARRTVAKYRSELNILPSHLRRSY